jgi:peroxiredoxin
LKIKFISALIVLLSLTSMAFADVRPGTTAPGFTLKDMNGADRELSDFKGKYIVLEWFNKDCPYVKKHYGSSNMQKLQKTYTDKGVVWLTIYSSAKGKQGYETPADALKTHKVLKSSSSFLLADTSGKVGLLYGAKTTPHMFIINPEQKVIYTGAIDDNSSSDPAVIASSKNYVAQALDASMSGKAVAVQTAKPYGCNVKY